MDKISVSDIKCTIHQLINQVSLFENIRIDLEKKLQDPIYKEKIERVLQYVRIFPGFIPVPRVMVDEYKIASLYWSLSFIYVEIEFNDNGTLTLFSRTNGGSEFFRESMHPLEMSVGVYRRLFAYVLK